MQSFRNQYELRRGKITLYQRTSQGSKYQSDNWHARFNITGHKAIRKSLKTCDQYEAEQIAEDLYQHLLQKTKRGLALSTKRFGLVCNSYVENLKHHSTLMEAVSERSQILSAKTYKSRIDIVERFIVPQLGDKNIDQMTDRDIEKYVDDRKTGAIKRLNTDLIIYERNGKKVTSKRRKLNPSHSTINKDLTVLRAIFEYARKQGLIDSKQIPDVRNVRKPKNYVDRKPESPPALKTHLARLDDRFGQILLKNSSTN